MKRQRSELTNDELAMAYELKQGGCSWHSISIGLNCSAHYLRSAVSYAVRNGIKRNPSRYYPKQVIIAAIVMRGRSRFSWRSIAEHVGASSAQSIRLAVWRYLRDY